MSKLRNQGYQRFLQVCEERGCHLLSPFEEYRTIRSSLRIECVCGKTFNTCLHSFKTPGRLCRSCGGRRGKGNIITIDQVRKDFKNRGFTLLSATYQSIKKPLEYVCDQGHTTTILYRDLRKGHGCKFCADDSFRVPFETIQSRFDELDLELLSSKDEYKDNKKTKLVYECCCGVILEVTWTTASKDSWIGCNECSKDRFKYDYNGVKDFFKDNGCHLISKEYENINATLDYTCLCGLQSQTTFKRFMNGQRCKECAPKRRTATNKEKYGVENVFASEKIKEQIRQTHLERRGVDHPSKDPEVVAKAQATNMKRYGAPYAMATEEVREKGKQTNLRNLGVEYPLQSPKIQEKVDKTCMEKFGVRRPLLSSDIHEKIHKTCQEKYGTNYFGQSDAMKELMTKLYGSEYYIQSEECKKRMFEKYGSEYYIQSEECKKRMFEKYGVEYYIQSEECKKRMFEKYGVEYYIQSEECKKRMFEKYGVEYYIQSESFKKRMVEKYGVEFYILSEECKKKMLDKYGVEYYIQSEGFKKIMTERYGTEHYINSDHYRKKMLEEHGVEYYIQSKEYSEKMMAKYGVRHPMQHPDILEKAIRGSYRSKIYTFPSGKEEWVQGYEPFCIDYLLKDELITEDRIFVGTKNMPLILYPNPYTNKTSRYFPDIYIPSENRLIEVKSPYTYKKDLDMNYAKWEAAVNAGFNFYVYIYSGKGVCLNEIMYLGGGGFVIPD